MRRRLKFDTTLGDLIVALTEEAGQYAGDEREKYQMVAVMLTGLLSHSASLSTIQPAPSRT